MAAEGRAWVAACASPSQWPLALILSSSRLATLDWSGKLIQLESVGGRAHESQCIRFVGSSGGAAYRNGGTDAFSDHAFAERHWYLKVL
jgi:hypothetical protein